MTRVQLFMKTKDRQGVNHMLIFERSEPKEKLIQDLNEMPSDALVPLTLIGDQADVTVRWSEVAWWLVAEVAEGEPGLIEDEEDTRPNLRPLGAAG